jgi:hypothetical protein
MKVKSRPLRSSIINKNNKTRLAVGALAASVWILAVIVWTYSVLDSHPKSSSKVVSPHAVVEKPAFSLLDDLWPDDYQDPLLFQSLHSCVDECHPQDQPSKKVALLVPPGSMGSMFVDFCKQVIKLHMKDGEEDFEIIVTSRLASHKDEFTHIIRFANLPMLLSVGDALLAVGPAAEATVQDVVEITELFVWWHCQISYLADQQSTPVYSVTMEYLLEHSDELEMDLRDFITALDPFEGKPNDIPVEEMMNSVSQLIELIQHLLQRLDKDPSQQAKEKGGVEVIVDHIVADLLEKCPNGLPALSLEGEMTKRVYSLMNMELSDEAICGDSQNPLSQQLACKERVPPFMAKQLKSK